MAYPHSILPETGEVTLAATALANVQDFELPTECEASMPPEARGLLRDEVRLMVSYRTDDRILHSHFRDIVNVLEPGDLLVINTSGTMNAAVRAIRADGTPVEVHFSTHLPADLWIVEVRIPDGKSTRPFAALEDGEVLQLCQGATIKILTSYPGSSSVATQAQPRLWLAVPQLPLPLQDYLDLYGFPIRYSYVNEVWPLEYYQTVYATERGSAEMPSAGRAFTAEIITQLVARGVQVAPLLLHTGVSSLEEHEPPYEEFYRVPVETASRINAAHTAGKRIVAVGTTVVRALETVTDQAGVTHPGEGWTRLIITPQRGLRVVNALLTGFHEPRASHLWMLEALCGNKHLQVTYRQAIQCKYLWHEFGDLHLLLP